MNKTVLCLAAALVLGMVVGNTNAADAAEDLNISGTVSNTCQLQVIDFTDLDLTAANWDHYASSPGALRVRCNLGTAYSVTPGFSENVDMRADYPGLRSITNGAGFHVPYRLFQDVATNTLWDVGSPITGAGTGDWTDYPASIGFYGRAMVVGDSYADTIPITVTYE